MGDINLNIYNEKMLQVNSYLNTVKCNEALHLITKQTRVLHHIITNDTFHTISPFIVVNRLTDHYHIICMINKYANMGKKRLATSLYCNGKNAELL